MVKPIVSDIAKQARDLARQVGMEALKVPGEVVKEGAKSVGMEGGFTPPEEPAAERSSGASQASVDQQLAATRAKMRSFAARQKQDWQKTEIQAVREQQQRVQQIVETQLGHEPGQEQGKETPLRQGFAGQEKGGIMGAISGIFKGKKSRRLTGVGQAKKDASGEFSKGHQ